MTAKKSFERPAINEERQKREAEALRANLARRKQQQRTRKSVDADKAAGSSGQVVDEDEV
ncbi:hypothetical protein [Thalassospira alkalitolerans]|uniref:Uncharacterized protein n=1 Tax=Thalassospira alkalitolerans TaxID=1293890 RepID=A0A1Y2LEU6_9PROT|nr:hypothetical protein [Thalassospira alkalitolerans]OSQ49599.1 hypothetical protein TALK_04540 [Thalassospira alkalitolerans]|tara:strand:- start:33204 stop:33383 length:180 start_codon:yes stop_codon:yes gene_type:complete